MKMSLRKRNSITKKIVYSIFLVVFFIFLVYAGIAQSVAHIIAIPFVYVSEVVKHTKEYAQVLFISEQTLLEENRVLQERIDILERQLLLGNSLENTGQLLPAKVIARPAQNVYGSLLIRLPEEQEVNIGDSVVTNDGVFIGTVDEITFSYARVILSSHPGFSQSAVVERSGIPITLIGTGGGNMKAELPQGADVEEYDIIVDLASGRVLAEVGYVDVDDVNAFTSVYMRMPVNIFEILEVFIIPRVS